MKRPPRSFHALPPWGRVSGLGRPGVTDMGTGTRSRLLLALCLLGCALAAGSGGRAHADPDPRLVRPGSVFLVWEPLGADALDRLRGGFVDLSGIKISFGLERMVWVNGELMQSLTLTVPDLTSLRKGSIGAVSVQGPVVSPVSVDPAPVRAEPVASPVVSAAESVQVAAAKQPGAVSQSQTVPAQASPTPISNNAPVSTVVTSGGATPTTIASVVQNGPGNVVMPEVLRNLGPGVFSVVQNSLNGQTIQGLTTINAQVSGLGSLLRDNTFLDLHLTLRGAGR